LLDAELDGGQSIAVHGGIDVGGVGLESLPDHQHRLAVGVLPGAAKAMSASIATSPSTFVHVNWNASAAPHTFSPLPEIV
jgi:hypothetical protein